MPVIISRHHSEFSNESKKVKPRISVARVPPLLPPPAPWGRGRTTPASTAPRPRNPRRLRPRRRMLPADSGATWSTFCFPDLFFLVPGAIKNPSRTLFWKKLQSLAKGLTQLAGASQLVDAHIRSLLCFAVAKHGL